MKAIFAPWLLLGAASSVLAQPLKGVGTLTAEVAAPGKAPTMSCQGLASMHLPETKVHTSVTPPGASQLSVALPSNCVATAVLKPSRGSNITMELWMPTGAWNAKLLMIGNDGRRDSVPSAEMVEPLRRGYAVVATDTGQPVHDPIVKAKALTAAYFGATPRYTYWTVSSVGGNQALKEVQMYPGDFDGVIVGAPAAAAGAVAVNATADLSAFKARGGKIIQYHDSADSSVPTERNIDYFERVAATQGGLEQTATFYRLFLIPAPGHANETFSIDWTAALEEWVERGRAPESVLANHNPPPNAAPAPPPPGAVVFEPPYGVHLMCAYPRIARLQSGLGEVPVDWICQPGPRG
jgi:hypothetical protein